MGEQSGARARALARRRRANVAGGRKHSHRVLVTPEEEERLAARATAEGVTVPRLLIESALAEYGETASQRRALMVELFRVNRLLGSIANNVNQIARHANAGDEFPADAAAAVAAVRRICVRVDEVIAAVAEP